MQGDQAQPDVRQAAILGTRSDPLARPLLHASHPAHAAAPQHELLQRHVRHAQLMQPACYDGLLTASRHIRQSDEESQPRRASVSFAQAAAVRVQ